VRRLLEGARVERDRLHDHRRVEEADVVDAEEVAALPLEPRAAQRLDADAEEVGDAPVDEADQAVHPSAREHGEVEQQEDEQPEQQVHGADQPEQQAERGVPRREGPERVLVGALLLGAGGRHRRHIARPWQAVFSG